jgi:hypothetical protein
MIAAAKACRRKFAWEYVDHWKPRALSVHLHAGAAYASGLEAARRAYYEENLPRDVAEAGGLATLLQAYGDFECPPDSAKSAERTAGALEFYYSQYPLDSDTAKPIRLPSGKSGIEFSFAEPLDVTHPQTGNPILYVGRMDMVVDYANGIFGLDDKTTSQLGASWSKQWDLRGQFTGYCWGAGRAGIPLQGFLIRGISILKTKYETQQALTYRPPWMIERWYENVCKLIKLLKIEWSNGQWAYDESESCNAYGGCPFRQPCLSADPQPWIEASFTRRVWNPLTRSEAEILP